MFKYNYTLKLYYFQAHSGTLSRIDHILENKISPDIVKWNK